MNLTQLEEKVGIGNGTIGKWTKSDPTLQTIKKIADYFHVPIEYFLQEEEEA